MLQNKRRELFDRMEYVLVRFRKVVRVVFGPTSKEYMCLKHGSKPGRKGGAPAENSQVPIEQSESANPPPDGAP